jgi:hypothetical protein
MTATVQVGEAIAVSPKRARGGGEDPIMVALEASLRSMLDFLARDRPESGS